MPQAPVDSLTHILARTLRELGRAGHPEAANRLAAEAYVVLRRDEPRAAERLNGVMHYLVRLEAAGHEPERSTPVTDTPRLDVRSEPPVRRHALIFETFEKLAPDAAFELVNDHDPKPLYYQLAAERPGTFTWEYLEEGPEVWRVRIGRASASEPVA
jgi:uncharacterized protein (DUF2249 family)